jgi:hypothetical protein
MTSPLARIESHPQEAKRLIGINYEQFLALVALPEQRHIEKQAEIEKNKIRIIAKGGGRKPEMSAREGVCLCLVYPLKNQFIVPPGGEDIVDVCVGMIGKTSDINLFRETRYKFTDTQKFLGDKAYIGDDAITTPHKKPKNTEISELQKKENKQLSSRRITVEHMICRGKIFRVASDKFRLARHRYSQVIMAVCALVRLGINRLFSLTITT